MFGFDDILAAAPLISSAGSFIGGIFGNDSNQQIAENTNVASAEQASLNRDFQASQAQKAMDYQTEMSNTSYQRSVKDMQAAGLNPMLAYMKGGASTPSGFAASGSVAPVQSYRYESPVASASRAFTEGLDVSGRYQSNVASAQQSLKIADQADAMTDKIKAETLNVPDQGKVLRQTAQMLSAQSTLMAQQGATQQEQQRVLQQTVLNLKKDGVLKDLDIEAAQALDNLGRTSQQLKPVVDILRVFLRK